MELQVELLKILLEVSKFEISIPDLIRLVDLMNATALVCQIPC